MSILYTILSAIILFFMNIVGGISSESEGFWIVVGILFVGAFMVGVNQANKK